MDAINGTADQVGRYLGDGLWPRDNVVERVDVDTRPELRERAENVRGVAIVLPCALEGFVAPEALVAGLRISHAAGSEARTVGT